MGLPTPDDITASYRARLISDEGRDFLRAEAKKEVDRRASNLLPSLLAMAVDAGNVMHLRYAVDGWFCLFTHRNPAEVVMIRADNAGTAVAGRLHGVLEARGVWVEIV